MSGPSPSSSEHVPTKRKRGRPPGSFKHRKDNSLLTQTARYLNTGHAATARQAFAMLTSDDDNAIRRLQRRWKEVGDDCLRMDRICHRERCEFEYRSLRQAYPALWARVAQFVGSKDGKRYLKTFARADGEPTHPMALGLGLLMEAVEVFEKKQAAKEIEQAALPRNHRPSEKPTAKSCNSRGSLMSFDRALEGWFTGNLPITPLALRCLAERANELADALEADLTGTPNDPRCNAQQTGNIQSRNWNGKSLAI